MNKFGFIPFSLLITLLVAMLNSASASECVDSNSNSVESKTNRDLDLTQMIKCLTEELASFEKTNEELRAKVSELEKTVFEGFESNLSEEDVPEYTDLKTNFSDEKASNQVLRTTPVIPAVEVDFVKTNRVSEKNSQ